MRFDAIAQKIIKAFTVDILKFRHLTIRSIQAKRKYPSCIYILIT
jgi:hypothetical protein